MQRREFLSAGCAWCVSAIAAAPLLAGCAAAYHAAPIDGSDLLVPLGAFSSGGGATHNFVIVENDRLLYPICLFRIDPETFRALWLRCTHKGGTLQVTGDELECPSHGSVFDSEGSVREGPAQQNLRTFPVRKDGDLLRISLK